MSVRPNPDNTLPLGKTDVRVTPIGLGAWQWGDRLFWSYGSTHQERDVQQAFAVARQAGINWVDTAEVYGNGTSERLLGEFLRQSPGEVVLATKFMPFPWRLRRRDLLAALRRSLERIGVKQVDLYQIHQPLPPVAIRNWMQAMAEAHELGLVRAIGVSNYSRGQMLEAAEALDQHGLALASNQVRFSLLARQPLTSGLLEACRQHAVTLIAYSPLAQGLLTGKYGAGKWPPGVRRWMASRMDSDRLARLLDLLKQVGQAHEGRTPAQVALNWVVAKGAVAIPGAKNAAQAAENAGAQGWHLTEPEVEALDEAADA
jgi:aryl-alcohol dehydrogenase-like predicted oxidoreductase